MRKVIILFLLLVPILADAQSMSINKAKKAGVVVLFDENVNGSATSGTAIYLRLKDKSRNDNWKSGVRMLEMNLRTRNPIQTVFPVVSPSMNNSYGISTTLSDKVDDYISITPKNGYLEVYIHDSNGIRTYNVTSAVFYKTIVDALSGASSLILGIEKNTSLAFQYIFQMFKVYD